MPSDLAEKLWNLANVLTGFNIAQAMAYVYAIGNPTFAKTISKDNVPWIIFVIGVCLNLLWIFAVWWCHYAAVRCPPDKGKSEDTIKAFKRISFHVTIGRIVLIVAFSAMSLTWAFVVGRD